MKAKVIIKELKNNEEEGLVYTTKDRGDAGTCFTMAMGFAASIAKQSGVSLAVVKKLVTDIYNETEDVK